MISSLSLHVSWKPVNPQECVWREMSPKYHEDHVAGKRDVHKYIPVPQAMKIPAAKAAVDKEWEKLEKNSGVESDKSQKQI